MLLLVVGCSQQSAEPSGDELVALKVARLPYISNTVLMIAEKEGYFEEQGLDVEFIPYQNTNDLITLLLAGEIDAAAPSASAGFFNAISRGGNIKIILPLTEFRVKDCSTVAYLARTEDVEAGLYEDKQAWPEVKLVVSTQALNSIPGYVLSEALDPASLTVEDMQIEVVDIPAQEEALRNGQVDIVYAVEPWITRMTAQGDIAVFDNAEQYAPGLSASVIVAGPKIIDNPDVGNRFAVAYLKAVRQYLEGPTERNVSLAVELTSLPEDLVREICWSDSSPDGLVSMDYLMDYQRWLLDRGLLDELTEPEAFYDPAFAEHAVQVLGPAAP
jgi:NitT/TauT family transport system substrate-binding protein